MKAYSLDLRERVVIFIQNGGSKAEAARRFDIGRRTVYRYLSAQGSGALAPKTSWGHWRKLDPQKLRLYVTKHPDATLKELGKSFGVCHHAVWVRLNHLGLPLKKSHKISRTQRGAALAVPTGTGRPERSPRLPSGRMRRGLSSVS